MEYTHRYIVILFAHIACDPQPCKRGWVINNPQYIMIERTLVRAQMAWHQP